MTKALKKTRILIISPVVTYLPEGMGNIANYLTGRGGGLTDVPPALIGTLYDKGVDIHVALPDYRSIFVDNIILHREIDTIRSRIPKERIYLIEDRTFFYLNRANFNDGDINKKIAVAFQREVFGHIIGHVNPDIIHCNDWMTGLIPAMSRLLGIRCLFTIHNIHTEKMFLSQIQDRGIDTSAFWKYLFYERMAFGYEEIRDTNPVDFLVSGVFAAHFINAVNPFLSEVVNEQHDFIGEHLRQELMNKLSAGCAEGIANATDPSFDPTTDRELSCQYGPRDHIKGKRENKRAFQKTLGLIQDENAPIFFWPSYLDENQKGCQLLETIFYILFSVI